MPVSVATHINERKVKTPHEAAVLADEYILTHKNTSGDNCANVQKNAQLNHLVTSLALLGLSIVNERKRILAIFVITATVRGTGKRVLFLKVESMV